MIKRKNLKKGICSFLLLSLTILCIPLQAKAASEKYDAANRKLTKNKNDFLPGVYADYELNLKNCTSMKVNGYQKAHVPTSKVEGSYIYRVTNTSKDANKYAIYRNGAKSMDKDEDGKFTYLDVKVYYWVRKVNSSTNLNAYYCGFCDGNNVGEKGEVAIQYERIHYPGLPDDEYVRLVQEYHFYKSGTAGTAKEVEVKDVKGVSCFSDIDSYEIWEVKKSNKPVDYARSKKTEDVKCCPNRKGEVNDNGKTHITKTSKDTNNNGKLDVIYYSGSHYVDRYDSTSCACLNNHKVWVDWETSGKDGITLVYRSHDRYSTVSYDAGPELRKELKFIHKVNGDEQKEGSKTGGRITFNTENKTPFSTRLLDETVTGTLTRYFPIYTKISNFKMNGFFKNGVSAGSSIKIKKVDKNDSLREKYAYVYTQDKAMPSDLDDDTTITFNWYALYYIDYKPNGGEGTMNKQTFRYGVEQKSTRNRFTKPNKLTYVFNDGVTKNEKITKNSTFKEWNTGKKGGGHSHSNGVSITTHTRDGKLEKIAPLATETWYAQWKDPKVKLKTPTRAGYTFKGWYEKADLTGSALSAGTEMTLNGSHTVYAKWEDKTAPKIASITATPATWSNSDGTVTIKASDKGSGLKKVELYRKSNAGTSYSLVKTFEESTATTADKTYTYKETTDGSHQYKAIAYDAAGNKTEKESNVIYIDKTAPNATITATPTAWSSSNRAVTINASDSLSGLTKVELYRKSNAETSYSLVTTFNVNPVTTANKTYTHIETAEDTHRYKVVAYDVAGNKREVESNVICIDKTPPQIASITATPTTWSSSDGTVTINVSDKESGLVKVELYRKSNKETSYSLVKTFTENPATTADKTYTYTETTDGSHKYKAIAYDAAGNKTESEESNVIYIDKTAPNTKKTSMKEPGERGAPVTKAYNSNVDPSKKGYVNSESYGLPVIIDTTDKNGSKDVSKIKYAYVKVYDTNNPSNVKYYDCGARERDRILKTGSDDEKIDVAEFMSEVTDDATAKTKLTKLNKLSVKREFIIDTTRDFNKILNLTFEVHVIDYAGNDAFTTDARLKKTHQRRVYVGGKVVRITKDNTLTDENEFRSGYTGVVQIHTTGWVDRVDLKWTDEILKASLKDAELNQPTMHYNVLLNMDPSSNPLMDLHEPPRPLNEPNEVVTLDTHDTTFTRNFYFRFWVPIYQEYTSEDDIFPFLTEDGKYYVDLTAERDYPHSQLNNGNSEKAMEMAQCIIEIGIIEGSSEMGLTKEEYENLGEIHKEARIKAVTERYKEAGADFVIMDIRGILDIVQN